MAFESTSRPDFFPDHDPEQGDNASPSGPEWTGEHSSDAVGRLASAFPTLRGTSSVDLALDLLLNQIVEQARLATTATGAAIALLRDGEMVCRATSGWNAPDLGMRISGNSGLSGKCIQTLQVQLCNDTETDNRVDAESCRRLNIRSILAYPLMEEGRLEGVFEIFSSLPDAFGERDIQTLEALRWRIFQTLQHASDATELPADAAADPAAKTATEVIEETATPDSIPQPVAAARDMWTTALSGAILVLTFLLVGLLIANWQRSRAAERLNAQQAAQRAKVARATAPAGGTEAADPPATAPSAPDASKNASASQKAKSAPGSPAGAGGLVVYEGGKVVFRMPPVVNASRTSAEPVANAGSGPLQISPDEAREYLVQRVEPLYPAPAREQHIEGTVLLQVVVSTEGNVREIVMLGGNEILAAAATDAVRQWKFRPYLRAGVPMEVQTQVTINFRLP